VFVNVNTKLAAGFVRHDSGGEQSVSALVAYLIDMLHYGRVLLLPFGIRRKFPKHSRRLAKHSSGSHHG
jgi:hypothetical protein